jgi:hypothetical protein
MKPIVFKDYPDFTPNLTPKQIFKAGAFGGTYFRPIYSSVTKQKYKNIHKKYSSLTKDLPEEILTKPFEKYDKSINKYKVKVGTTLEYWEEKEWIHENHPYGWVHWYIEFYEGKRFGKEDERQIERWKRIAGPTGRFRKRLINQIRQTKDQNYQDFTISPRIRQTLLHWGYELTLKDYKTDL